MIATAFQHDIGQHPPINRVRGDQAHSPGIPCHPQPSGDENLRIIFQDRIVLRRNQLQLRTEPTGQQLRIEQD